MMNRRQFLQFLSSTGLVLEAGILTSCTTIILPPKGGWPVFPVGRAMETIVADHAKYRYLYT